MNKRELVTTLVEILGAGVIVWGVSLIYLPLAIIVAGIFLILGGGLSA